jgi:hypothetical protein
MKNWTHVVLLFCALFFIACNEEPQDKVENKAHLPAYRLEAASSEAVADISDHFTSLRIIPLSAELSLDIGWLYHFYVIDSSQIILVDEDAGKIHAVDFEGNLIWQISSRTDDYRYFQIIDDCVINRYARELVVIDGRKLYRFDFAGNPIDVIPYLPLDYKQLSFYGPDEIVCSTQGLRNSILSDEPKQLAFLKNGTVQAIYLDKMFYAPEHNFIGGYPEFSLFKNQLYYHSLFRDTFYSINFPEVKHEFTFEFKGRTTTKDIMVEEKIKNKLSYANDNAIPYPCYFAIDSTFVILAYKYNLKLHLAKIDRNTSAADFNARHLNFKGDFLNIPTLYENGYFLDVVSDYEFEMLKSISPDAKKMPTGWAEKLQKAKDADLDLGKKYLYLLEI